MLQLNLLSLVLAIGWFFSTQDRWEPAIVFLGLLGALVIQIRPYFSGNSMSLSAKHRCFVLTIIALAFFVTRPSATAHLGAILKYEFNQSIETLKKKPGGPLVGLVAMAIAPANAFSQRHVNLLLASFSLSDSTLTIGALGYVVVFNPSPHVSSSYEGEKFFLEFREQQTKMIEFFDSQRKKRIIGDGPHFFTLCHMS